MFPIEDEATMIGVITNPRAGKNVENRVRIEKMRQILGREGILRETQTREEISNTAREFHRRGIDILAIDGGDGTLQHTLSAFIPIYHGTDLPQIVLLKGGTMNTIARSLGTEGVPEAILRGILSATEEGAPFGVVRANILEVNDRYGFIFGLGFPVSLLEAYYRGEGRGIGKVIRVFLRILCSTVGIRSSQRAETPYREIYGYPRFNGEGCWVGIQTYPPRWGKGGSISNPLL
jgi:diacylglycerol kinase family enzyme